MLEYTKEILMKVSFDKVLFRKELRKAMKWLKEEERTLLMLWCFSTFGTKYYTVIEQVFRKVS
jgi:hypothetical protein